MPTSQSSIDSGPPARPILCQSLKLFSVLGCLTLSSFGCGGPVYVDIDSKPSGAIIFVDGERRGMTRSRIELDFGSDETRRVLIQLAKPRYKPAFQYWTEEEVPKKRVFVLEAD